VVDVEGVLAITFLFGGGTLVALAFSPIGKVVADRIRYGKEPLPSPELDHGVYEELDRLRNDVTELQERVDFAERLLAKGTADAGDAKGAA
jgi:hypothetical protein